MFRSMIFFISSSAGRSGCHLRSGCICFFRNVSLRISLFFRCVGRHIRTVRRRVCLRLRTVRRHIFLSFRTVRRRCAASFSAHDDKSSVAASSKAVILPVDIIFPSPYPQIDQKSLFLLSDADTVEIVPGKLKNVCRAFARQTLRQSLYPYLLFRSLVECSHKLGQWSLCAFDSRDT